MLPLCPSEGQAFRIKASRNRRIEQVPVLTSAFAMKAVNNDMAQQHVILGFMLIFLFGTIYPSISFAEVNSELASLILSSENPRVLGYYQITSESCPVFNEKIHDAIENVFLKNHITPDRYRPLTTLKETFLYMELLCGKDPDFDTYYYSIAVNWAIFEPVSISYMYSHSNVGSTGKSTPNDVLVDIVKSTVQKAISDYVEFNFPPS